MSLRNQLRLLRAAAHNWPAADAHEFLSLISVGNPYDQVFFTELQDEKWLPLLAEAGFFSDLPRPQVDRKGQLTYPPHFPLIGLSRVASKAPQAVADILSRLDIPDNPTVADQVMRSIAAINDTTLASQLVPILERALHVESPSNWIWLDDILVKWLQGDAADACLTIVRYVLELATQATGTGRLQDPWRISEIDRQVIALLGEQFPIEVANIIFNALTSWARAERDRITSDSSRTDAAESLQDDPDFDFPPTYWLDQFGSHSFGIHDAEATLANRLYELGRQLFGLGDARKIATYDALLRSDRWHLFRRLRWQLYADFPAYTLMLARGDTLQRVKHLGDEQFRHGYEFASMVEAHVKQHGERFLSAQEMSEVVNEVQAVAPAQSAEDEARRRYFQRRQLWPFRALLHGEQSKMYEKLSAGGSDASLASYLNFGIGGEAHDIEHVAPEVAEGMQDMSDSELWRFLNTWEPTQGREKTKNWWIEESVEALGDRFAAYVDANRGRFNPTTQWWGNIHRPAILHRILDRATKRLIDEPSEKSDTFREPTPADWEIWFGVAAQIAHYDRIVPTSDKKGREGRTDDHDWTWPRIVAVKFLTSVISGARIAFPEEFRSMTGSLLRRFVADPDLRLTREPSVVSQDWLSTAINSVRGTAIEGLLELGLNERKKPNGSVEPWIFDTIASRLRDASESPAVFAIIGSHLRLVLHLFQNHLASQPALLLGTSGPQRNAFIESHIRFDRPALSVIQTLPQLPQLALNYLREAGQDAPKQHAWRGDFGMRLGSHLAFYYWNNLFSTEADGDSTLDDFFETAKSESRAATINDIGRIFERSAREDHADLYRRVMRLWDRRFSAIEAQMDSGKLSSNDGSKELAEFIDWLKAECFPFDWRFDRSLKALRRIEVGFPTHILVDTLEKMTASGERLNEAMRLLYVLIHQSSGDIRWSYRDEDLQALLRRGYESQMPVTRHLAEQTQEALLRRGFFEYLDIGPFEGDLGEKTPDSRERE